MYTASHNMLTTVRDNALEHLATTWPLFEPRLSPECEAMQHTRAHRTRTHAIYGQNVQTR